MEQTIPRKGSSISGYYLINCQSLSRLDFWTFFQMDAIYSPLSCPPDLQLRMVTRIRFRHQGACFLLPFVKHLQKFRGFVRIQSGKVIFLTQVCLEIIEFNLLRFVKLNQFPIPGPDRGSRRPCAATWKNCLRFTITFPFSALQIKLYQLMLTAKIRRLKAHYIQKPCKMLGLRPQRLMGTEYKCGFFF